jgi:hypothetical protein
VIAARSLLVVLALSAGCSRSEPRAEQVTELKPVFSDETVVGELRSTWQAGTESGDGQRVLRLRIEVVNQLADDLYLRLRDVQVLGPNGALPVAAAVDGCILPGNARQPLIEATIAMPAADAAAVSGISVDSLSVPLSERGRAFHREFLRRRRATLEEIDAELDGYAAAPPCLRK